MSALSQLGSLKIVELRKDRITQRGYEVIAQFEKALPDREVWLRQVAE